MSKTEEIKIQLSRIDYIENIWLSVLASSKQEYSKEEIVKFLESELKKVIM